MPPRKPADNDSDPKDPKDPKDPGQAAQRGSDDPHSERQHTREAQAARAARELADESDDDDDTHDPPRDTTEAADQARAARASSQPEGGRPARQPAADSGPSETIGHPDAPVHGGVITPEGGEPITYETARPGVSPDRILRSDSPEVVARHPANLQPKIDEIDNASDLPKDPIQADQVRTGRINEAIKDSTDEMADKG